MDRIKYGACELCDRTTELTFHHLIPKKMHRRTRFQKAHSKEALNAGVNLCRLCHKGILKLYDEKTLAERYSSLELLRSDAAVFRHLSWVAKQKS